MFGNTNRQHLTARQVSNKAVLDRLINMVTRSRCVTYYDDHYNGFGRREIYDRHDDHCDRWTAVIGDGQDHAKQYADMLQRYLEAGFNCRVRVNTHQMTWGKGKGTWKVECLVPKTVNIRRSA